MCFLPLKSSHYLSRPVPVPELFDKYPTRPVPKSKAPTRHTLLKMDNLTNASGYRWLGYYWWPDPAQSHLSN